MDWELRLGDCLDPATGLASLADKSVDHVITDPPYGQKIYDAYTGALAPKERKRVANNDMHKMKAWEGIDSAIAPLCAQFRRLAQRWQVVFSDEVTAYSWMTEQSACFFRFGAWIRQSVSLTHVQPARGYEAIIIGHSPTRARMWNGGMNRAAVYGDRNLTGGAAVDERYGHPCPKPLGLMEKIVRDFTDPGDLICDPFAGSGTTGVAAIRLGRRFIGWEKNPKYHAIAMKRLSAAREQLRMFEDGAA